MVLTSVGIENHIERSGFEDWAIYTRGRFSTAAISELEKYASENTEIKLPSPQNLGSGWLGAVGFLVAIIGIPFIQVGFFAGIPLSLIGRMDNQLIIAGEWWRPVTALTLHADLSHLLANGFFGVVLGVGLARHLGSGYAWFLIFLGGIIGNILSSSVRAEQYLSLGASTAVFAALGITATYVWRRGYYRKGGLRRNLTPLFGAVALFSFAGIGDLHTDVIAHLTGLISGMILGLIASTFDPRWLGKSGQLIGGGLSLGILILCWAMALTQSVG